MSHRILMLALSFAAVAGPLFAQVEEEEIGPRKPPKKIIVPDDDPPKVAPGTPNSLPDLNKAEAEFQHPALKAFFVKFAVPHDRITSTSGRALRIAPVPLLFGKDKFPAEFGVQPLDDRNRMGEAVTMLPSQVRSVLPYEQLAIIEVDALLKLPVKPDQPAMKERLLAAERLLTQVLAFHDDAVAKERRLGKSWAKLKTALDDKQLEVRLTMARETAAGKDWPALKELILRYSQQYRAQPKVMQEFAALRLVEAEELAKRYEITDLELAQAILREYETQYPNTALEPAKRLRAAFSAKAKQFLENAQRIAHNNQSLARNILRTVESLDPTLPGVQELRNQLSAKTGTLVVGTRRMPELMSPATARFDSEKQVVELLFDGLLEAVPDETLGSAYRPALASGKPRVITGGREMELVAGAEWAEPARSPFTIADVISTLQLHREKRELSGSVADAFEASVAGGSRLNLRFKQLHPDPRALLTLKVLPAQWMKERKLALDDESFAREPFGTGPFRLPFDFRLPIPGSTPGDFSLIVNQTYARRHPGQPAIQGIRFLNATKIDDILNEMRGDRLHILTDIPTADVPKYEALPNASVATAANNRRIHLLAINHRNAALQDPELRRGIQAAIDRETILNDVFRAGEKKYHKPLNGPFPPDSWAIAKGVVQPLYQPAAASAKLKGAADRSLTLIYPNDEPLAEAACKRIAKQVTDAGLPLKTEGVPPRAFLQRVELEHRYDLAYVAFDYPDDWYPLALAQWLDGSAAARGGRNYLGYLAPGTNSAPVADRAFAQLLADVQQARDFSGEMKPKALEIHAKFAGVVPFVPLWQLDRHTVVSKKVKLPYPAKLLNPTTLFHGVADWKLDDGR